MDIDIPGIENKWKSYWSQKSIYRFDPKVDDRSKWFAIDTPPPTISGKMHMGHAFSYPHQDFIARYKRMRGYNVYYPWGFDDNGLPTERFTEKSLGIKGEKTELKEFIRLCMIESEKAEKELLKNWSDLGFSANFENYYRTFSDTSIRVSQRMFLDLVRNERTYREEAPVVRCPTCTTAISQIEMKDASISTDFVYIRFGDETRPITIATTRPELIGACVALMVNPDDERYRSHIGKNIKVPLYGYDVPIIADELVSIDKGTGAEMLCTFGDQNDLLLWRKYNPGTRIILDDHGKLNENSKFLKGLNIHDARKKIIDELKTRNLIEKTERVKHFVNTHERCNTPVEIGISKQWFVRYLDLKDQFKKIAASAQWFPDHMRLRLDNWIDGLKWDWCISRQRFLGVPFPVWYCSSCGDTIFASEEQLPVDPRINKYNVQCNKCGSTDVIPEMDVMDTWATSSLSPRLALEADGLFDLLYPMDVRFQGHDIITFWAFTTIVRSSIHDNSAPWKSIFISGNVYDPYGQKMSKSKGNIVEPGSLITQYGADAVRYWASTSVPGDDIKVKEQDFVRGRRTVIKIYNAAKLVSMITEDNVIPENWDHPEYPVNVWIVSKLNRLVELCAQLMDTYQFSRSRAETDNFFWNTFCDNYLEIAKSLSNKKNMISKAEIADTVGTLQYVLLQIMKLYAPIMPFITEEIYSSMKIRKLDSIHLERWPEKLMRENMEVHETEIDQVISVISGIRAFKTSKKLPMSAELEKILIRGQKEILEKHADLMKIVMNVGTIELETGNELEVLEVT